MRTSFFSLCMTNAYIPDKTIPQSIASGLQRISKPESKAIYPALLFSRIPSAIKPRSVVHKPVSSNERIVHSINPGVKNNNPRKSIDFHEMNLSVSIYPHNRESKKAISDILIARRVYSRGRFSIAINAPISVQRSEVKPSTYSPPTLYTKPCPSARFCIYTR